MGDVPHPDDLAVAHHYRNLEERLLARSAEVPGKLDTPCWLWLGRVEPNGYAKIGVYEGGGRANERVRNYWVHRVAYETFCGPIPAGMDVDHRCYLPLCINPGHLEAVPKYVNQHTRRRKR